MGLWYGWYRTGIIRDPDDLKTWRRVGDGQAVEFSSDSWVDGYPRSDAKSYYVNLGSLPGHGNYHNKIVNYNDTGLRYFICEFKV